MNTRSNTRYGLISFHCRNRVSSQWLTLFACALPALAAPLTVHAQSLLTNGNFETGSFTGWTLANQLNPADINGADHFYISTPGSDTPLIDGFNFPTAANPGGGNFYAVTASDNPGAHALLQSFTVPLNSQALNLSFQMFVNDQSGVGPAVDPSGLDYTTGGTFNDNQYATVDILKAGAGALSTASADLVENLYRGVDNPGGATPNPYLDYAFNLSSLTPGDTYTLRFAEVDNLSSINMGVDNVSLLSSPTPTPEPGSLALFVGMGGTSAYLIRRRRQTSP